MSKAEGVADFLYIVIAIYEHSLSIKNSNVANPFRRIPATGFLDYYAEILRRHTELLSIKGNVTVFSKILTNQRMELLSYHLVTQC